MDDGLQACLMVDTFELLSQMHPWPEEQGTPSSSSLYNQVEKNILVKTMPCNESQKLDVDPKLASVILRVWKIIQWAA